jgi:cysteine synthase B
MKPSKLVDLIGNTPLVISTQLVKNKNIKLLLKLEGNNPEAVSKIEQHTI